MTFRKVLFWVHLAAGIISGLSIGIMCFTGTVLAFEKELIAWAERGARRVEVPAGASRLTIEQMQARLREAQPEARPMSIVFQNDPAAAVAFSSGRSGGFYVNPYTGDVRQPASAAMSGFMHTMTDLHRYLGFHGEEGRPRGKLINGVCNLAFCVLAVTGLYLWMPRSWSWRAVRPVIWFRQNATARARDFNWHNAIGFWTAPILIVLTLTAVPISFQWGGRLINTLTGTPPSAAPAGGGRLGPPAIAVPAPAPGTPSLSLDALLTAAQKQVPVWQTITLRTGNPAGPGAPGGRGGRGGPGSSGAPGGPSRGGPAGEARPANPATLSATSSGPVATTFSIRESGTWPRTATTTLSLNPFTGDVVQRTGYADLAAAQQVRSWTRFLHTGEALGKVGQFIAGLASLGGVFLVYTGFALSWRRFFGKGPSANASTVASPEREPAIAGK
jgi:uncharacterized iron-regulated membrane protein